MSFHDLGGALLNGAPVRLIVKTYDETIARIKSEICKHNVKLTMGFVSRLSIDWSDDTEGLQT
jgi:hypothetical protein